MFSPDVTATKSESAKHGNGRAVGFWSGKKKWAVLKMGVPIFRKKILAIKGFRWRKLNGCSSIRRIID